MEWTKAKDHQKIRLGDGVFVGAGSRSWIKLNDGSEMALGENTLVTFNETSKLMDLDAGNFRLRMNGSFTFTAHGQVATVEGSGTDMQVVVPKKEKPYVRLLGGKARLRAGGQVLALAPEKIENLPSEGRSTASVKPVIPETARQPTGARKVTLYDVFLLKENKTLVRRPVLTEAVKALPTLPEKVSFSDRGPITIDKTVVTLSATGEGSNLQGYVYELSRDKDFPPESTTAEWRQAGQLATHLKAKEPGTFFYRVRGVDQKLEMTAPSEPVAIVMLGSENKGAVADAAANLPKRTEVKNEPLKAPALQAQAAPRKELKAEAPIALSTPPKAHPRAPERMPASIATSVTSEPQGPTNGGYKDSQVDLEIGAFTAYSPDEKSADRAPPFASTVGIRARHWLGDHSGLEAIANMKASNLNETASGINPLRLEGRYHYRFWLERMSLSAFAGAEYYRNIGHGYFAQGYNLGKIGTSINFPMGTHWLAGGDLAFGLAASSTTQWEAMAKLDYFFERRYSIGIAYRLLVLSTENPLIAPVKAPYKESWGEGFLAFGFHY